jgi:hypothetical protein
MFKLVAGVDCPSQRHPGVLVKYTNDWSPLGLQIGSSGDNVQIGDLMIVETTNTDLAMWVDGNDAHIVTRETSISTTVDECTKGTGGVGIADGISPLAVVGHPMYVMLAHLRTLGRLKLPEELLEGG